MRTATLNSPSGPPAGTDSDASFLGWQETLLGDIFPLYTITVADHPSCHSTVSDVTLHRMRLRVPRTPSPYPEAGPSPWHTLGIELNHPATAREAIELARREYMPVTGRGRLASGMTQGAEAAVRREIDAATGHVVSSYEPLQNGDPFSSFDAIVYRQEAVYETAGILGPGNRFWILAKLPGYIKVHRKDIVNKYLLLTSSPDGTAHVRVKLTPIRAVCNNTLTSTFHGAGDGQADHSLDDVWDPEQAAAALALSHSRYEQLNVIFNGMADRRITPDQLREYVRALVPDDEESESAARTEKIRNSVLDLHESGRGAHLARGTLWGAFNTITEYADHMMSDGNPKTRLNSIWFGRGERLKSQAFNLAEQMLLA